MASQNRLAGKKNGPFRSCGHCGTSPFDPCLSLHNSILPYFGHFSSWFTSSSGIARPKLLVRGYDPLHENMADDIALLKFDKCDAIHLAQHP